MYYMGLDVSSSKTGWAIIDDGDFLDCGVIIPQNEGMEKLTNYYWQLCNLLSQQNIPKWICIEDTYVSNPKTIRLLSYYAGASLLALSETCSVNKWFRLDDWKELKVPGKRKVKVMPTCGVYFATALEALKAVGSHVPNNREDKKIASVDWVNQHYPNLKLNLKEDDVADAIILANTIKNRVKEL